jgi:hypothetical protein
MTARGLHATIESAIVALIAAPIEQHNAWQ